MCIRDRIYVDLHFHLVYQYICGRCPKRYIGESVGHFTTRKHEHTSGQPEKTETTLHSSIHPIKAENFKIKFRTRYTKTAEAMYIKSSSQRQQTINSYFSILVSFTDLYILYRHL